MIGMIQKRFSLTAALAAAVLLATPAACCKTGDGDGIKGVDPGEPVIFFTDLTSAPAWAYVTIWGSGFGSSQGDSTLTLRNLEVENIISWSDSMIEFQVPATAKSGNLQVHTSEGDSPPYRFKVHMGMIFFVAQDGFDDWSGTVEIPVEGNGPFRTLKRGKDSLRPGDILYVRAGTYTGEENYSATVSLKDVPSGTNDLPIAIAAYPGEEVIIGDNTTPRCFSLYRGESGSTLDYLTISKFQLRPFCSAITLTDAHYGRFIGNDISGATDACMSGAITAAGSHYWKILANTIHDNGNTKFEHAIYLGGYGTCSNFEIAWNRISQQTGGRGIQLYGHEPSDCIEHISIHDNVIFEIDRDGVVLGSTDADVLHLDDIIIYNNIFQRCGRCTGWGLRINNPTADSIDVFHNTFVGNGHGDRTCHESSGDTNSQLVVQQASSAQIRNNIIVATGSEGYIDILVAMNRVDESNNLFFGAGDPPDWVTNAVTDDPAFVEAAAMNFHVAAGSPAIDAGKSVGVDFDHDGIKRPQGEGVDIGAYESPQTQP